MCGRIVQASDPLRYALVDGLDVPDSRIKPLSYKRRAKSAPLCDPRKPPRTGERSLDLLRWGLIPHGCPDPEGRRKPINARAKSVAQLPSFCGAYAKRRCIVPVDCFFEWRAVKGARAKTALRRRDERPHAVRTRRAAGELASSAKRRVDSQLHDHHRAGERAGRANPRPMPLILPKNTYERRLGAEPDPHDLLVPFPSELMVMWPVSTRVSKPENDDASLLDPAA
jgi:putative SOS response-associated peptidase YedK